MIGLVWVTARGEAFARHVEASWEETRSFHGKTADEVARAWRSCDSLVLFMATGIAVRAIAPLLDDKNRDPAVVAVDDAGRYAVVVCGGHRGGNDLALAVQRCIGAEAIVTTAGERLGMAALDKMTAALGFKVDPEGDRTAVAAALVSGDRVSLVEDERWPLPPLPPGVVRRTEPVAPCLMITDRLVGIPSPGVVFRPPTLVAGVGCSRGVSAEEVVELIRSTLFEEGLSGSSLTELVSVDVKSDERGLLEAARSLGLKTTFVAASALASVQVPNPSETVREAVGTPSVAEAAVIARGARLIVPKRISGNATVAIGRLAPRGRISIVGTGPGDLALLPDAARDALARSEVAVGLSRYIEQVRAVLRPWTRIVASEIGDEVARAETAISLAGAGHSVALISGGDAGVYAMASPLLERVPEDVDVHIVPGITAASAAAALLGAPLGHDHCSISLSDLLTPWELIRERVRAAGAADFVIAFYNPRSRRRTHQLREACDLLLEHRDPTTPVGVVVDAFRSNQQVEITTLAELDHSQVGMTTIVIVGNSLTRVAGGRMVTPRGYR